jgi:uncharacterized protein
MILGPTAVGLLGQNRRRAASGERATAPQSILYLLPMTKEEPKAARPCPIWGKPAHERFQPLCLAQNQTLDVARWIGGDRCVPAVDEGPSSEENEAEPQ